MRQKLSASAAMSMVLLAALLGCVQQPGADEPNSVIAVGIVIEPDATMVARAKTANERLLNIYPQGFALDETHRPHMTVLQRYVRSSNLVKVYEAVDKVLAEENPAAWTLKAYKYYFAPWGDLGLAGIVIQPTDELIQFQEQLIDAVAPFTEKTGTEAAFVAMKEDGESDRLIIDYVTNFVPDGNGENYNPHVTIGLASRDYLKKLVDEQFKAFTFSPAGVSVYQLGSYGTARKKFKEWELRP